MPLTPRLRDRFQRHRGSFGLVACSVILAVVWISSDSGSTPVSVTAGPSEETRGEDAGTRLIASPTPQGTHETPRSATPGNATADLTEADATPLAEEPFWFNTDYPTLSMRFEEIQARRAGHGLALQQLPRLLATPEAWVEDDAVADGLVLEDDERLDGRVFIRFNPDKLESLVAGDRVQLPVSAHKTSYTFQVDSVEVHDDASLTWTGRLLEFDRDNQVTFTQGQSMTYGGITTPEGSFVIQVEGNRGWLVDAGTLFKGECEEAPVPVLASATSAVPAQESTHPHPHIRTQ